MTSETVSKIAAEYGRILDEGYTPDVDEFLRHVPENLRAETRRQIGALLARRVEEETGVEGPTAAPAPPLTPVASASSPEPVAAAAPAAQRAPAPPPAAPEKVATPAKPKPAPIRINLAKPEVVAKPVKPQPSGPVKMTPEEARAMFREMERRPARAGR